MKRRAKEQTVELMVQHRSGGEAEEERRPERRLGQWTGSGSG